MPERIEEDFDVFFLQTMQEVMRSSEIVGVTYLIPKRFMDRFL